MPTTADQDPVGVDAIRALAGSTRPHGSRRSMDSRAQRHSSWCMRENCAEDLFTRPRTCSGLLGRKSVLSEAHHSMGFFSQARTRKALAAWQNGEDGPLIITLLSVSRASVTVSFSRNRETTTRSVDIERKLLILVQKWNQLCFNESNYRPRRPHLDRDSVPHAIEV